MSPRTYNMGKRADAVERTRAAIRAAALEEYGDVAIGDASMQAIARRAGVAAGTVLYHYEDAAALARDVVEHERDRVVVPTAASLDPTLPLAERVQWLARTLFRMHAETDAVYRAWVRSREHPVMREFEAWFGDTYQQVLGATLAPDRTDPLAFQVVSAVIDPGFRSALLARGLSEDAAAREAAKLANGWLGTEPG